MNCYPSDMKQVEEQVEEFGRFFFKITKNEFF